MSWFKKSIVLILMLSSLSCFALRDIFDFGELSLTGNPLEKLTAEDLSFAGAIIESDREVAYVEDVLGNIYPVKLGQRIGMYGSKVIKIYQNQILLLSGQNYLVIK